MSKFETMTKRMEGGVRRTAKSSKSTNDLLASWGKNIGGAASQLTGFGSGLAGILTVAGLVKQELGSIEERLGRAGESQLNYGQKLQLLINKLPRKGSSGFADMGGADIGMRLEQSADPDKAIDVMTSIHGATSDIPLSRKTEIAEYLTNDRKALSVADAKEIGTAIAITLAKDPRATIPGVAGLLAGAESTIAALPADLHKFGFNPAESLQLGSAVSVAINDPDGSTTRTALANFAGQLEETKAKFGIEEKGMALLRAMRTGKTDSHKSMRNHLLGVFSQSLMDEGVDLKQLKPKDARLKLRGKGLAKLRLMELLNPADFNDPTSLYSTLKSTASQMPVAIRPGTDFQVDMGKTYGLGERWMKDSRAELLKTDQGKMFAKVGVIEALNKRLEQKNGESATQNMLREQYRKLYQNLGSRLPGLKSSIDYYTKSPDFASSEEGITEQLESMIYNPSVTNRHGPKRFSLLAYMMGEGKDGVIGGLDPSSKGDAAIVEQNKLLRETIEEIKRLQTITHGNKQVRIENPIVPSKKPAVSELSK